MAENRSAKNHSFAWKAAAILLGVCLIFYWKILFTSQAILPWDAPDQFYPLLAFVHDELRNFRLPLWDPYVMSGYPIIGDVQAQIFYPVNWLYVALWPSSPLPFRAVEIVEVLHFFLAGFFMYLLARDFVESDLAALLSGILYMSGGAMVAHTQHTPMISSLAWFPLVFLTARRAILRKHFYYAVAAGGLFGVQILAGHWQNSVYLGLFLFLYYACAACGGPQRRDAWPFCLLALATIATLGAAVAMLQIIPALELGSQSVRSYVNYLEVSVGNHPRFLWTLLLPNFLGGINGFPMRYPADLSYNYVFLTVPGTLLALWGLIHTVRRQEYFWLGAVLLFTELSFGAEGFLARGIYHIPVLNLFRTMATFFNLVHFSLCLLAGVGADQLFRAEWTFRGKAIGASIVAIVIVAGALGALPGISTSQIPGWRHAVAALILFAGLLAARMRGWLRPRAALAMLLALTGFELWFYNSNQAFNSSPDNPATFLSANDAVGRSQTLAFLRSDPANDFRVAALGEYQWSGNAWSLWRISGITGVNPLALRRYNDFVRIFSHVTTVRIPMSGEDHNFASPLVDLLGVKYVVLADPSREVSVGLAPGGKFRPVFNDMDWWRVYENRQYLHHLLFFTKAYTLPDVEQVDALMSSPRFDPRQILLLEQDSVSGEAHGATESLPTAELFPGGTVALSGGQKAADPYCAQPVQMIGGWGKKDDALTFTLPSHVAPGNYRLLIRYTANELAMSSSGLDELSRRFPWYRTAVPAMPQLQAHVGEGEHAGAVVSLPRTLGWPCHEARTADLGEFSIGTDADRLTITSVLDSTLNIYTVLLVRIPDQTERGEPRFSSSHFAASANRISFDAQADKAGFLLLNEIYYPGWQATADGRPSEIMPADGTFRALYISAGSHHVEFVFRPRGFFPGLALSLLSSAGILIYLGSRRRRSAIPPNPR